MMKSKNTQRMAKVWMLFFSLLFMLLAGRFLYIQTTGEVQGIDLNEWADKKRSSSYQLDATRGRILDQNGMTLAYDRPTYRLYAIVDEAYSTNLEEPKHVTDPEKTAEMLAPLLDMKASEIETRIESGIENNRFQVEFGSAGKDLSQQKMKDIKQLELAGINFIEESKRYYPNGTFASHIIGFSRPQGGESKGVTGVEKQMQKYLQGSPGRISYQRDKYGVKLLDPKEVIKKPDDGDDVMLTIDQKIQTFLEDAMGQVEKQYKPKRIMGAVMDPDTGEILALGNRPSYNPNQIGEVENWYNDIVSYPFEPGSTMKIFTWASAMEEGVYNGSEEFKSGNYQFDEGSRPIYDHRREGWGNISYDQGMRYSSNVAAAKLAKEKIGLEKFRHYLDKFGFGQKTGIDLPGEETGRILYDWPVEKLTTAFGQGTTTTPIQLLTAASAVANDGKMMKPYVLSKVLDSESGEVKSKNEPETISEPISPETAKQMRELLGTVVSNEEATGNVYQLNDYSLAGKTGTAQIPDSETGRYMSGKNNYIFSFLGMAPEDDPELLIYVAVQQPELEVTEYGPEPVAHIVKTVTENSLHYLDIRPDQESKETVDPKELPEVQGDSVKKAKEKLGSEFNRITVIGSEDGKVEKVYPEEGTPILPNQRIFLVTNNPTMPDITGWSARDVFHFADMFNLKVETMGNGFAFKQSAQPGAKIQDGGYLVVEFQPPGMEEGEKEETEADSEEEADPSS
ncbi:penicillin-binding protein 2B [Thalassobacillus cyri]|uniref:serine-type D-Ala-D-Ala carboxypeptidase n=1 Tax=Thalassobacillus cyri TaxID=571932 RepID=A0A1H4H666_9BACI|nr:penicillin-binding protein 2B [Thalassobacillus cyri]